MDLIGTRTLTDLLVERASSTPDKPWLIFEDRLGHVRELTYAEFLTSVRAVATGFQSRGVGHGDTVILHLRNSPEFLIAWFALASLGAVMVPSNTANTASEMEHMASHTGARMAITQPEYLATLKETRKRCPDLSQLILVSQTEIEVDSGVLPFTVLEEAGATKGAGPAVRSEDVMQLLFTSGTTALPKAVMLTQANAMIAGERTCRTLGLDSDDRCLTALPVFHVNAQCLTVLGALTAGATCILLEEFSASKYWGQLRHHRATQTSVVAMQARTLLAQPARVDDRVHSIRRFVYAINITDDEKADFEDRFGVSFINAYGLSEAMTIVAMSPVFGPQRWPSVGLPGMDRRVRVIDADGNEVAIGEVGEITVHGIPGRTIMKGYFRDPDATKVAIRDGWLYTGDHGYFDEYGYLYFFDRRKDVIKRAGENVSASEVESVLMEHPDVVEAAVIGVPDAIRDEAVRAYVVPRESGVVSAEELAEWCRQRLAGFKVPSEIQFRDDLPKTSIGKIQKKLLRDEA